MSEETTEVVTPVETTEVVLEKDLLTLTQEKLAKAEEERDNYKNVALKRLGKLPNDAEFLNDGEATELSVAEQVRLQLLEREVELANKEKSIAEAKLIKENAELRLALKNQPGVSSSGSSSSSQEVKDNVFSEAQLADLRKRAARVNADPEAFIEKAKQNLKNRS